jgi:hypothetical protein
MRQLVEIENIDDLRRRQGIQDVELWEEIRGLRTGDFVRLTLLSGPGSAAGETLLVRITSIRGSTFRGELARRPTSKSLARVRVGAPLAFTADHIHSIPEGLPTHEQ